MPEKKKKRQLQRPPTDLMTHGALWFILSIVFFILNYYGQSVLGYTLTDPQIYQFLIAPAIWGGGLLIHILAEQRLKQHWLPSNVPRRIRHTLRDIHIGVFVAFFMMLVSMGTTASMVGTGSLNVTTTLMWLVGWGMVAGLHSWIVHLMDEHGSLRHRNNYKSVAYEENRMDTSRLVAVQDSDVIDYADPSIREDYRTR